MITPPLDETRRQLLAEERGLLGELRDWLVRLGATEEARRALVGSLEQLDEPFLLAVVGDFNAGKSSFINALLGQRVLEEGITPTTARVGLLRYGEAVGREVTAAGVERLWAPAEVLREIVIVDTPGTNAVLREHEALTRDFVPRADLVLFVTSAERPFTERERAFLEAIREWGKKVVIVLKQGGPAGAGRGRGPAGELRAGAGAEDARVLTRGVPGVGPVGPAGASFGGRGTGGGSGFPAFEARVTATLDEAERFRLKLQNPIGVARRAHREVLLARLRAAGAAGGRRAHAGGGGRRPRRAGGGAGAGLPPPARGRGEGRGSVWPGCASC